MTEERINKNYGLGFYPKQKKIKNICENLEVGNNACFITRSGYIIEGRVRLGEEGFLKMSKGTNISRRSLTIKSERYLFLAPNRIQILL